MLDTKETWCTFLVLQFNCRKIVQIGVFYLECKYITNNGFYKITIGMNPRGHLRGSLVQGVHPIVLGNDSRCGPILWGGGGLSSDDVLQEFVALNNTILNSSKYLFDTFG